jgi:cytidylate kinase
VILPDADVKIFLTASPEARARRRTQELADKGMPDTYENVLADMLRRDEQDRSRDVAPAIAAPDAVHFDNSYDGFDEAVEAMLALIREGLSKKGKEI